MLQRSGAQSSRGVTTTGTGKPCTSLCGIDPGMITLSDPPDEDHAGTVPARQTEER